MRIIFICGCLEPGHDGVGDYTRRLAVELIKKEHEVKAISIFERQLNQDIEEFQNSEGVELQVLRLPSHYPKNKTLLFTKSYIDNFNPKWISLQFVPFSFNAKGIPFFFPSWLAKLNNNSLKWHFMFHELWVANGEASSLKEWLHREMQKWIIKNLKTRFRNAQIDTSNQVYHNMLKQFFSIIGILPIFSNLPKGQKKILPRITNRDNKVVGVFFGHLQENPNLLENLTRIKNAIESQMGKQLEIFYIGNNRNPYTLELIKLVSSQLNIPTFCMGYLDAQEAANILYNSDIGLSNYPGNLIQKSGSIASMLFNELPIILLNSNNLTSEVLELSQVAFFNESLDLKMFINQSKSFSYKYDPFFTAQKLEQKFLSN